jgi:hypothetical protein
MMDRDEDIADLLKLKRELAKIQAALVKLSSAPEALTLLGAAAGIEQQLNEAIEVLEKKWP